MKTLDPDFAAHLGGDVTTVCRAWRLIRRDGSVLGFTEHDRDLAFDGTVFAAAAGFAAGDIEDALGLAVASASLAGALSGDAISEADLAAGLYDGARLETFLVNWQAPLQHHMTEIRELGEVRLAGGAFEADLSSLAHRLDRKQGRLYGRRCDAELGSARCGVDLTDPVWWRTGHVVAVGDDTRLVVAVDGSLAPGFLDHGRLDVTGGRASGTSLSIASHHPVAAGEEISLWQAVPGLVAAGDPLRLVAGCDKSFATCKARFANGLNFQGFPHMPGPDFAYGVARRETRHDGRPLFD